MKLPTFLILFFLHSICTKIDTDKEQICPKINVSTNSSSSKNDIVSNGIVANIW